jgi:hypothetical protein
MHDRDALEPYSPQILGNGQGKVLMVRIERRIVSNDRAAAGIDARPSRSERSAD